MQENWKISSKSTREVKKNYKWEQKKSAEEHGKERNKQRPQEEIVTE